MKTVTFKAEITREGEPPVPLEIRVPVDRCWDHRDNDEGEDLDEGTPVGPHVFSHSAYHTDYALCLGVKP